MKFRAGEETFPTNESKSRNLLRHKKSHKEKMLGKNSAMGKASWAQQAYQGYHVSLDLLLFFSYLRYFPEILLIPVQVSNGSRVSEKAGKHFIF